MNFEFKPMRFAAPIEAVCPDPERLQQNMNHALNAGHQFGVDAAKLYHWREVEDLLSKRLQGLQFLHIEHSGVNALVRGLFYLAANYRLTQYSHTRYTGIRYGVMSQTHLLEAYLSLPRAARKLIVHPPLHLEAIAPIQYSISWRGVVGVARVASVLHRHGAKLFLPNTEADMDGKVDLAAEIRRDGRLYKLAIQVKTSRAEGITAGIASEVLEGIDPESEYCIITREVLKGVERINTTLGSDYVPVVVIMHLTKMPMEEFEECPEVNAKVTDLIDNL